MFCIIQNQLLEIKGSDKMHSKTVHPQVKVLCGWIGSRVVSVLDSGAVDPGIKSQPRRSEIGSSHFKGCEGNCRPGGK